MKRNDTPRQFEKLQSDWTVFPAAGACEDWNQLKYMNICKYYWSSGGLVGSASGFGPDSPGSIPGLFATELSFSLDWCRDIK